MKTYTAILYATLSQEVSVQAENEEQAKWKMLELFDRNLAEFEGETDIENFEEIDEVDTHYIYKLTTILGRARELAVQVTTGDAPDPVLAEEVCGELSEFIEHLEWRTHYMDQDAIDPALAELAKQLRGEKACTTSSKR